MKSRVVLVDDHTLVRAGLRTLLESLADVEVVGEAADGRSGLDLVAELRPDIVLMDISMPGLNGFEATAHLAAGRPRVALIILSMHSSEAYVRKALRDGASGYLLKDAAVSELPRAIAAVLHGETYVSSAVSHYIDGLPVDARATEESGLHALTARQREILQLLAEGQSTKEMAHMLGLSTKTIETHRRQIMERLAIFDVPGFVRFAVRHGLVGVDR